MNRKKLIEDIVALYRKTATQLPDDITDAFNRAKRGETSVLATETLAILSENLTCARKESKPICQDTGIPIFYIEHSSKYKESEIEAIVKEATDRATDQRILRPNAVDPITDKNIGNLPVIHFREGNSGLKIELLLKGGGSENLSTIYQLPNLELAADRNLEGVRRCVLDAVFRAQGKGCPPYIIGVAIGGNAEEVTHFSKKQLMRKLDDKNAEVELAKLETRLQKEINQLGIGVGGFGGNATALGVKIITSPRHPASFFIGVSFSCWCLRRQSLCIG